MKSGKYWMALLISLIGFTACPSGIDEEEQDGIVGSYVMDSFSLSSRRSYMNSSGEVIQTLQAEDQMISSDFIVEFFEDGTFYGEGPIEIQSDVITIAGNYVNTYGNGEFRKTTEGTWKIEDNQLKTSNDDWVFQVMTNKTRINYPDYFCFRIVSMDQDEIFLEIDAIVDYSPLSGLEYDKMTVKGNILLTRII